MHTTTVLQVIALLLSQRKAAAVAAGDNEHHFLDLCALIALTQRPIPELPETQQATTDYQEIQKLNISLSGTDWRKQFDKTGTPPKRAAYKPSGATEDSLRKERRPYWINAEDEIETDKGPEKILRSAGADGATQADRQRLLALLQPIAEAAASTFTEIENLKQASKALTAAAIHKKIQTATYGEQATAAADLTAAVFKAANGNPTNRKELCGDTTSASAKARTLTAFLYCICAGEQSQNAGGFKACSNAQPANADAQAALTNVHTAIQGLINVCPEPGNDKVTPDDITKLIAAVAGKTTSKAQQAFYGTFAATDCGGLSGSGLCVYYKTTTKADSKAYHNIQWKKQLSDAANDLRDQQLATQRLQGLLLQLKSLKKQAYNLRPQLEIYKKLQVTAGKSGTTQEAQAKKGDDCKQHTKNATCTENNCKWKATTEEAGTCEAKAEEQKSQGTGEGASGTSATTGCTRHGTDKTACENDKTGDKQNCAWRKGKDDEPDKETEKCRNGCFLVNNKFALMTASFASLVAF
ncbi:variant surface glycoprotein (VSG, atypical), putative [Trypanosoma brucei brucei TREU927]|uniref:Variant surface glycoprotein (VSG, atypical), putative n=2 Tax=Trypanosoma brucei TaxID=5691 RepID=Q57XI6_TRYB2|nr:variant surface glycoprotein (VSG, atypical), putative [Trypanosoma brucei brucei TREU927]AAX69681.1 variant surface glycoprotein (VSG, atypical), putative [Trypanosoma brucei]AAZ12819.1 variant surface glycoprotein (VSG, atypical), putative [Trypanosoma brucei brucei TREU927]APD73907.1 variant surface glycoprotein 1125.1784 [Trypanosoma brucei]